MCMENGIFNETAMATRTAALAWLYLHSLRRFSARSTVFSPVNLRLTITLNHFRHYISFNVHL